MIKKNERKKAQRKEKICDQEASNRKQTDLPGEVNNIQKKKQKKKTTENRIEKSTVKTELIKVNCVTKTQDERWRILVI